ncbi:MAG TPA: hypothetical protein VMW95_03185, partial [Desulfobacterales bacterium]|nr:hypothetical protein [Desulfobacterales bacterium]
MGDNDRRKGMPTPYSLKNRAFTDNIHMIAREKIYPYLFGVQPEEIEYCYPAELEYLDLNFAIDKILKVKRRQGRTKYKFTYTIQERFRPPECYEKYKDITITLENTITGQPSELYKIAAQVFVYGYVDNEENPSDFIYWVAVD